MRQAQEGSRKAAFMAEGKSLWEDQDACPLGMRLTDWSRLKKMPQKLSETEEIKQYQKTFLFAQETAQRWLISSIHVVKEERGFQQ